MVIDSSHGEDGFEHARSAHRMAVTAFIGIDGDVCQACPFDGHRLHLVVEESSRTMGINEGQGLLITIADDSL